MNQWTRIICLLGASLGTVNTAQAAFQGIGESEGFTLGIIVGSDFSGYAKTDHGDIALLPYASYSFENAKIAVDGLSYTFFETDKTEVSAAIEYRDSHADQEDSIIFNGIHRKSGVDATLGINYRLDDNFYLSSELLGDVSGTSHKGYSLSSKVGYVTQFDLLNVDLGTGVTYRNSALSRYLYEVKSHEVNNDRSQYTSNDTLTTFVDLTALYQFSETWFGLIMARYDFYSSDIKRSPLIGHTGEGSIIIGVAKRW